MRPVRLFTSESRVALHLVDSVLRHFITALADDRVIRALELSVRDETIRRRFAELRQTGMTARSAIERLAADAHLSDERIRTIVYRKGR